MYQGGGLSDGLMLHIPMKIGEAETQIGHILLILETTFSAFLT